MGCLRCESGGVPPIFLMGLVLFLPCILLRLGTCGVERLCRTTREMTKPFWTANSPPAGHTMPIHTKKTLGVIAGWLGTKPKPEQSEPFFWEKPAEQTPLEPLSFIRKRSRNRTFPLRLYQSKDYTSLRLKGTDRTEDCIWCAASKHGLPMMKQFKLCALSTIKQTPRTQTLTFRILLFPRLWTTLREHLQPPDVISLTLFNKSIDMRPSRNHILWIRSSRAARKTSCHAETASRTRTDGRTRILQEHICQGCLFLEMRRGSWRSLWIFWPVSSCGQHFSWKCPVSLGIKDLTLTMCCREAKTCVCTMPHQVGCTATCFIEVFFEVFLQGGPGDVSLNARPFQSFMHAAQHLFMLGRCAQHWARQKQPARANNSLRGWGSCTCVQHGSGLEKSCSYNLRATPTLQNTHTHTPAKNRTFKVYY